LMVSALSQVREGGKEGGRERGNDE
jgi:hypothetical protein